MKFRPARHDGRRSPGHPAPDRGRPEAVSSLIAVLDIFSGVELSSLTPVTATALAACVGLAGTILGVLMRGVVDGRLLRKQLDQAQEQMRRQTETADRQLERQLVQQQDQFSGQLEYQREERRRDRAEARAQTLLQMRRDAYLKIAETTQKLSSSTIDWEYKRRALERLHPGQDWDATPALIDDPLGFIQRSNRDRRGEEARPFDHIFLGDGQAINPLWLDASPTIAARNELSGMVSELYQLSAELELIAPPSVYEIFSRYIVVPSATADMASVEAFGADMRSRRSRFVEAARQDLGGDISV